MYSKVIQLQGIFFKTSTENSDCSRVKNHYSNAHTHTHTPIQKPKPRALGSSLILQATSGSSCLITKVTLSCHTLQQPQHTYTRTHARTHAHTRTRALSLSFLHLREKIRSLATHFSTLAWKIPWTEGPGGLQSMGSLGVGHD